MMTPQVSTLDDFTEWMRLAREVEPLFGPMAEEPAFREALQEAIRDGRALCVRRTDAGNRMMLQGGIVISREANEILWLAVEDVSRGQGIGKALLAEAIRHLDPDRLITVTTFDGAVEAGLPARRLYQAFGFKDVQPGGLNPAGIPTVVMVCEKIERVKDIL